MSVDISPFTEATVLRNEPQNTFLDSGVAVAFTDGTMYAKLPFNPLHLKPDASDDELIALALPAALKAHTRWYQRQGGAT